MTNQEKLRKLQLRRNKLEIDIRETQRKIWRQWLRSNRNPAPLEKLAAWAKLCPMTETIPEQKSPVTKSGLKLHGTYRNSERFFCTTPDDIYRDDLYMYFRESFEDLRDCLDDNDDSVIGYSRNELIELIDLVTQTEMSLAFV